MKSVKYFPINHDIVDITDYVNELNDFLKSNGVDLPRYCFKEYWSCIKKYVRDYCDLNYDWYNFIDQFLDKPLDEHDRNQSYERNMMDREKVSKILDEYVKKYSR